MRRGLILVAVILGMLTASTGVVEARQTGSGTLSGVVLGPDDRPVPHASVTYQSSNGSAPHAVHADSRGHFAITKLRADNYDLRASGRGVFSQWEKNVSIHSGENRTMTLHLIYAREIPKSYVRTKPKS